MVLTQTELGQRFRARHPERYKATQDRVRRKIRLEVLSHYSGGTPKCALCGFADIRALAIDHMNGGGGAHRRKLGLKGGSRFYYLLRKQGYPEGYRILCFNCNQIAYIESLGE